jgi:hypothetical protein
VSGTCQNAGGCPHVFTWDGNDYVKDNNLMPKSETVKGDVEDYYLLHQPLVEKDGKYSLLLKEFEQEHDFFDQVKLLTVYHDSSFKVAVDPSGNILTYKNPVPPLSAVDNEGNNLLDILSSIDDKSFLGEKDDYIIVNFSKVDSKNAKLVMRADWRCCYLMKYSIHVQFLRDGEWQDAAIVIPRNYWATEIVDVSKYVNPGKEFKIRLYFTKTHKLDFVGLDTNEEGNFEVKETELISAVHSTQGDVKQKLVREDKSYAELIPGQEIKLEFNVPKSKDEVRDFILISKGRYYKIEDRKSVV